MDYEFVIMVIATIIILATLFIQNSNIDESKKDILRIITLVTSIIISFIVISIGNRFAFIMFSLGFCVAGNVFNVGD